MQEEHRYRKPETIHCPSCGWDSGIGKISWIVIYHDVICPSCGMVVISGKYSKKGEYPSPWPKPWPKRSYDECYTLSC